MQLFTKILAYKREKKSAKHPITIYRAWYTVCGMLRHYLGTLVPFNQIRLNLAK